MKTVKEYKQELVSLIQKMETEHGMDIREVDIYMKEAVLDDYGKIQDKRFKVKIIS